MLPQQTDTKILKLIMKYLLILYHKIQILTNQRTLYERDHRCSVYVWELNNKILIV